MNSAESGEYFGSISESKKISVSISTTGAQGLYKKIQANDSRHCLEYAVTALITGSDAARIYTAIGFGYKTLYSVPVFWTTGVFLF